MSNLQGVSQDEPREGVAPVLVPNASDPSTWVCGCVAHQIKTMLAMNECSEDFPVLSFATIARMSGLEIDAAKSAVRQLAANGVAEFWRCSWSDDGQPSGAGYALTAQGRRAASAIEARRAPFTSGAGRQASPESGRPSPPEVLQSDREARAREVLAAVHDADGLWALAKMVREGYDQGVIRAMLQFADQERIAETERCAQIESELRARDAAMALIVRSRLSLATEVIELRRELARITPNEPADADREAIARKAFEFKFGPSWSWFDGGNSRRNEAYALADFVLSFGTRAAVEPVAETAGEALEQATGRVYLAIYGEGMDPHHHPEGWDYAEDVARAALATPTKTAANPLEDEVRGMLVNAYRQGALDVHNNWQEDRDPDFTEAAHDYASSVMHPRHTDGDA